ncbi:DUF1871 family protein [Lacicoccus alkaliphilus]|uniref:DUF1871 domain-containing protein n=1 Tax=Lacicoccus alkaliphilus DSM 16010 TaxID=1123231 RepID=A0A1M7FKI9_9BACL|nr:DUF1871 family protein [Salinicoccus alkaliphilus]SHM04581.1 protein of unknown function [Salinicoccus alkaliphilus DSM 16010]
MNPEGNVELYRVIENWNPMKEDEDMDYDAEIYDIIAILYDHPSKEDAALGVQSIFEFAFSVRVPLKDIHPMVENAHHIIDIYKS